MEPFNTFKSDWRNDADISSACAELFQYLLANRLDHYSFAQLRNATNNVEDSKLAQALQYLSSPRCKILRQVFLFFDETDEWYELSDAAVAQYLEMKAFPHPETGKTIHNLNQISVAFELGEFFQGEDI